MTTITVIAVDRVHGWAYVHTEREVCFVQPPYLVTSISVATLVTAYRAVEVGGFDLADNEVFPSWARLFEWLDVEFVTERIRQGLQLPTPADTHAYVRDSSSAEVRQFLRIAKYQFVPASRFEAAVALIRSLRAAPILVNDVALDAEVRAVGFRVEQRQSKYSGRLVAPLAATAPSNAQDSDDASNEERRELPVATVAARPLIEEAA